MPSPDPPESGPPLVPDLIRSARNSEEFGDRPRFEQPPLLIDRDDRMGGGGMLLVVGDTS